MNAHDYLLAQGFQLQILEPSKFSKNKKPTPFYEKEVGRVYREDTGVSHDENIGLAMERYGHILEAVMLEAEKTWAKPDCNLGVGEKGHVSIQVYPRTEMEWMAA